MRNPESPYKFDEITCRECKSAINPRDSRCTVVWRDGVTERHLACCRKCSNEGVFQCKDNPLKKHGDIRVIDLDNFADEERT